MAVVGAALRETTVGRLAKAGCVAAEEEADELMAQAADPVVLDAWTARRERGEPLAWITRRTDFCGTSLIVDPGVYVPRRQSEELARRGAVLLAASGGRAVDLCTGAGAIACHLARTVPSAMVAGVDLDTRAVACARRNGVRAIRGDLGESLRPRAFDLITSVAPYVPTSALGLLPADVRRFEPMVALDGGTDGLDVIRRIVVSAAELLRPGGWLLLELGGEQDRALTQTLGAAGFASPDTWFDDDECLRGLAVQLSDTFSPGASAR